MEEGLSTGLIETGWLDEDKASEECGVVEFYLRNAKESIPLRELQFQSLFEQQHRGQLSAGTATFNPYHEPYEDTIRIHRSLGGVEDLLGTSNLSRHKIKRMEKKLTGTAFLGHVRYATAGKAVNVKQLKREMSPDFNDHMRPEKMFSIGINGNMANYPEQRASMEEKGLYLRTGVDTEIIKNLICFGLNSLGSKNSQGRFLKPNLFELAHWLMEQIDGSYSLVGMFGDGEMFAIRDPLEIKPFSYGFGTERKSGLEFFVAGSESVVLNSLDVNHINEVPGGSCLVFDGKELKISRNFFPTSKKAHCQFEWIYFSSAQSTIYGIPVDPVRLRMGEYIARNDPLRERIKSEEDWLVIPVPMTGIPYAEAISRSYGISWSQAILVKTRKRGFIQRATDDRVYTMQKKYGILRDRVKGKKLLVVEDSQVRGETSRIISEKLRVAGATEVHFRFAEPMITSPCFYGIAFGTYRELMANSYPAVSLQERNEMIARDTKADSVYFPPIEILKSIGLPLDNLCTACLNGDYPTSYGFIRAEEIKRLS